MLKINTIDGTVETIIIAGLQLRLEIQAQLVKMSAYGKCRIKMMAAGIYLTSGS
jgi:hypothetical protein